MLARHGWWAVIPMKDTRRAKSRLDGRPGERRQLAIVMARDTICAVVNASHVIGTVVVCQREEDVESFSLPGVEVLVRPGLDLNQAVAAGERWVRASSAARWVATMPGDLPYLCAAELDLALQRAAAVERACVADRAGVGTTLLTARDGVCLSPAFGAGSLEAHVRGGAVCLDLPDWSGLRRDVDVSSDLTTDAGLGPRTGRTMREIRTRLGDQPAPTTNGAR